MSNKKERWFSRNLPTIMMAVSITISILTLMKQFSLSNKVTAVENKVDTLNDEMADLHDRVDSVENRLDDSPNPYENNDTLIYDRNF